MLSTKNYIANYVIFECISISENFKNALFTEIDTNFRKDLKHFLGVS